MNMRMNMNDYGFLELSGLEFHAFHGCGDEEKQNGNTFLVDFKAEAELKPAAGSDRLEDTVDLAAVYAVIRREMEQRSDLLEHVCGRIVDALHRAFPGFTAIRVTVSKQNPPLDGGVCAWSRVSLTYGDADPTGI